MARPLKPLARGGGYYPSKKWTPLVYNGGYTTMNGGEPPEPPTPVSWKTVTGVSPLALANALAHSIKSLTQFGKCVQDGTPTPDAPVDIVCNNGVLTKPHDTYTAVDGQGTYASPGAATNRIYKALNVEDGSYTIFVPTAFDFIVQYKTPTDGSTPTDSGNVGSWVNGYTTVTLDKGAAYGYGIAIRNHVNIAGNISPSDFSGTIVVVHDDEPVKAVGTPEVLTVNGQNLVDLTAVTDGYYYDPSGVYTALAVARLSDYIPVKAGQKYTVFVKATADGLSNNVRCNLFDTEKVWKSQSVFVVTAGNSAVSTITPTENGYLRVSANYTGTGAKADWSVLQIVRGEYTLATMPPYEPYVTPQTVNDVPMLLSVGDYKDEVELVNGPKTVRIGVKVLTGDNTKDGLWGTSAGASNLYSLTISDSSKDNTFSPISTHFVGILGSVGYASIQNGEFKHGSNANTYFFKDTSSEDVTAFKARLAAQYANGTPVIVVYPLATETTEQTTPHSLHTAQGTNVVSVTSNVDPVNLTAVYASSEE